MSTAQSLQDLIGKKSEERKCIQKKIEAEEIVIQNVDKEMVELKRQQETVKEREEALKERKEAGDKRVFEMKSYLEKIDHEMEDMKVEFKRIASAPW